MNERSLEERELEEIIRKRGYGTGPRAKPTEKEIKKAIELAKKILSRGNNGK